MYPCCWELNEGRKIIGQKGNKYVLVAMKHDVYHEGCSSLHMFVHFTCITKRPQSVYLTQNREIETKSSPKPRVSQHKMLRMSGSEKLPENCEEDTGIRNNGNKETRYQWDFDLVCAVK